MVQIFLYGRREGIEAVIGALKHEGYTKGRLPNLYKKGDIYVSIVQEGEPRVVFDCLHTEWNETFFNSDAYPVLEWLIHLYSPHKIVDGVGREVKI